MYIIYKYTNTINGKSYIGKTNNPGVRHKFHSRADGTSPHFHAAINKYKFESFEKQVLVDNIPTNKMACSWEIYLIAQFDTTKTGYNITKGGECGGHIKYDEVSIKSLLLDTCCHRAASEKYNIPFSYVRSLRTNNELYPHLGRLQEYHKGFVRKLSETEAIEILNDPGSKCDLAERYGVKLSTIDDIRLGRTWKHLPRPMEHRKRIPHKRTRLTEGVVQSVISDSCSHLAAAEKYKVNYSTVRSIRANTLLKWKYIDRSDAPAYVRQARRG